MRSSKIIQFLEHRMRALQVEMATTEQEQQATIQSNYQRVVDAALCCNQASAHKFECNPCIARADKYPTRPLRVQ